MGEASSAPHGEARCLRSGNDQPGLRAMQSITADLPDPSPINTVVPVNYSVVVNLPGVGTPSGNVTVSDGRLTVANAAGSVNNKICFIEVNPM